MMVIYSFGTDFPATSSSAALLIPMCLIAFRCVNEISSLHPLVIHN
jgi:hypothetical protein